MTAITISNGRIARRNGLPYRRARRPTLPILTVSEAEFMDHVFNLAALFGWHGVHIIHSHGNIESLHSLKRRFPRAADHEDASGLPDLLLVHPGRGLLLLVELKTERGRVRPGQARWLLWVGRGPSVMSTVWRPQDEAEIRRVLEHGW
jgi:VRR-NUC domain-containing protein